MKQAMTFPFPAWLSQVTKHLRATSVVSDSRSPPHQTPRQRKCKGGAGGLVQSMVVTSALRPGGIPRGQAGDSASRSRSRSAETRLRNVE